MKHYEDRPVTVEARKVLVKTTCDLCGEDIYNQKKWPDPQQEVYGYWSCNDVSLTHHKQWGHSDGGESRDLDLDICPACFETDVLPALVQLGLSPERAKYTELDW